MMPRSIDYECNGVLLAICRRLHHCESAFVSVNHDMLNPGHAMSRRHADGSDTAAPCTVLAALEGSPKLASIASCGVLQKFRAVSKP